MPARQRLATAAVFALALTAAGEGTAHADPPPPPAYRLRLELDLAIVLVGGAITSSFLFLDEASGVACAPACDRSKLNFLDRPAAGLYDESWNSVGNIGVAGTLAMPLLTLLLHEGPRRGANDIVVLAEAAIAASALQVLTSYAVGRPRPRVYGDDAPLEDRTNANAARSFFSGHVADVLAVTVAGGRTFERLGFPTLGWIVLAAGSAGTAFIGVSRVLSGAHFPTDVIAGAAVGAGLGLALPALHDSPVRVMPTAVPGGGAGLAVAGPLF